MSSDMLGKDGPDQPPAKVRLMPMTSTGRILVPIDFSMCSLAALEHALGIAARFHSTVEVLHVWPLPGAVDLRDEAAAIDQTSAAELADAEAGQLLAELMAELAGRGIDVHGRIGCGDASAEIVRIAGEDGYDLIVMGTHGRSGAGQLARGSVAEQVIRRAGCPVLTIRVVDDGRADGSGGPESGDP